MPDEKCFIPTLRQNLKTTGMLIALFAALIIGFAIVMYGCMVANDYMVSSGAASTINSAFNAVGTVIISNHTITAVVIFAVLIVLALREVSIGHKRWGYLGIVYTVYGFAVYMLLRALFWIHAIVMVGQPDGSYLVHDALGGLGIISFIIVAFLSWCGIAVPFERAIEKCFK